MTIGEHLKRLREGRGLSQGALALRSGVPQAYISLIERGYRQPGEDMARTLLVKGLKLPEEEARHLLREWRLARAGLPTGLEKLAESNFVTIPIVGSVPCGPPREVYPDVVDYFSLPASQVNPRHHVFSVVANGLSMVEDGIVPGDLIVIDQDATVQHGDLAVVKVEEEVTLKRVFFRDDYVELRPANGQMKAIRAKEVEFVGKVTAHVRRFG
jgi:repressor LexA